MYCFCTYFDRNYLTRGLALHRSLRENCPDFRLWVLCMDDETYRVLNELDLPEVEPIALQDFENGDALLLAAKPSRSRVEYYFTCTPSLPLYILNHWPAVDLITYLDADLFFFSDPVPLFDEIGDHSIAIIAHRFPLRLRYLEMHGIYNVGWLTFRRDEQGLSCLQAWRDQCIEWCFDRVEEVRFGDQKYLDDWPQRYTNAVVLQHTGANLAPWNVANYQIHGQPGRLWVDDQPLIFYHFQDLVQVRSRLFRLNLTKYHAKASAVVRRKIYGPYLLMLNQLGQDETMRSTDSLSVGTIRYANLTQNKSDAVRGGRLVRAIQSLQYFIPYVDPREYVWIYKGRAF